MAIKDGRCPNCGSIVHLDPNAEKGHCMFCDAVFDNQRAFEIAENPEGVEFPNDPQPPYDGPNLQPGRSNGSVARTSGSGKSKKKQPAKTTKTEVAKPKEYVMKEPVKLPDFKLSKPVKLKIAGIILAVVIILSAIMAPLIISRDAVRSDLLDSMGTLAPFTVDTERAVAIERFSNSYLLVASGDSISQEDAISFFIAFCQKRAELIEIDSTQAKAYSAVTMKLVTPDGGWLIKEPVDLAAVESGSAVKPLAE